MDLTSRLSIYGIKNDSFQFNSSLSIDRMVIVLRDLVLIGQDWRKGEKDNNYISGYMDYGTQIEIRKSPSTNTYKLTLYTSCNTEEFHETVGKVQKIIANLNI